MPQAVQDVLDHLAVLPPFPRVTTRLLELLGSDSASFNEIASVVATDPSLAMKVIHVANSPFYMLRRPVQSVKDAVLVLGVSTVRTITVSVSITKGLSAIHVRSDMFDMLSFWTHSFATATAGYKLGVQRDKSRADSYFLAGLIHDIGKIIIASHWPEVWRGIMSTLKNSPTTYEEVEARMFGSTHYALAAELCRRWSFPEELTNLVGHIPLGVSDSQPDDPSLQLMVSAHRIVNAEGFLFPVESAVRTSSLTENEVNIGKSLWADIVHQLQLLEHK